MKKKHVSKIICINFDFVTGDMTCMYNVRFEHVNLLYKDRHVFGQISACQN